VLVTRRNPDLKLNTAGMTVHVLSYIIYCAGLIYWFFDVIKKDDYTPK